MYMHLLLFCNAEVINRCHIGKQNEHNFHKQKTYRKAARPLVKVAVSQPQSDKRALGGGGDGCHATLQHKHHHVTNVIDIRGSFGEYTLGEYTQAAAAAGRSHSYALPPAEQPDRVTRPCQPAHQLIPLPLHLLTAFQVSGAPPPPRQTDAH